MELFAVCHLDLSYVTVLQLMVFFLFGSVSGIVANQLVYRLPYILYLVWYVRARYSILWLKTYLNERAHNNLLGRGVVFWPLKYRQTAIARFCKYGRRVFYPRANANSSYMQQLGWLVILLYGLITTLAAFYFCTKQLPWLVGYSWLLLLIAILDIRTLLIPDFLVYLLACLGIIFNLSQGVVPLTSAIIGVIGGYLFLRIFSAVMTIFTRQDNLGQGDMKLVAALGAWLGWETLPQTLLLAATLSLVWLSCQWVRASTVTLSTLFPFAPFLAAAGWLMLFSHY